MDDITRALFMQKDAIVEPVSRSYFDTHLQNFNTYEVGRTESSGDAFQKILDKEMEE